ncbi:MAG: hypothetical protein ACLTZY_08190 [Alistipes indistinctus]
MKTTLLLPNGFKKIGWAIFVPAFLLGCSICFFRRKFRPLAFPRNGNEQHRHHPARSSAPSSSASRAKKSKTK